MRSTILGLLVVFCTSACGGGPVHRVYSAPAPQGALQCALRTMSGLGYEPIQGGVNDGYIKFNRFVGTSSGARLAGRLPGFDKPSDGAYIVVTEAGQTLRVSVSSYTIRGERTIEGKPSSEANGHAEAVVATCAHPSSHDVQGRATQP